MQGLLLLFVLQQMGESRGESNPHAQPLLQLDKIVTERIHSMIEEHLSSPSGDGQMQETYQRLKLAADLPIDQLDRKITAYNELRQLLKQGAVVTDPQVVGSSSFDKRVINLLQKLGIYDKHTETVFRAILNDPQKLKELKKRLDELDNEKNAECCIWDIIFGLF
ncbi:hypothetical protein KR222_009149 [Zaprionus bogoriensis]|nr:hypothetical protein KR222_009149 [Zaprionus bogoriensis]